MCNYKNTKFDYETKLIDNRKQQITDIYTNELQFANNELNSETSRKVIADLVIEQANMKKRINDLLIENSEWKKENLKLNNQLKKVRRYINMNCKNQKISEKVGFDCYTMADTQDLEKIMKILGE